MGGGGCALPPVLHDALGATVTAVEPDDEVRSIAREYFGAPGAWGEFVGGCNDGGMGGCMTLDRQGKLKPMLAAAGSCS